MKREQDFGKLKTLRDEVAKHPDINDITIFVNMGLSDYESATILRISNDREDFNSLYELQYLYRGGLVETKLNGHYIIYGFDFD